MIIILQVLVFEAAKMWASRLRNPQSGLKGDKKIQEKGGWARNGIRCSQSWNHVLFMSFSTSL